MDFLKGLARNLVLLVVVGLVLYLLFPDIMSQVLQLYGAVLGPVAILILVAAALPRRRRR